MQQRPLGIAHVAPRRVQLVHEDHLQLTQQDIVNNADLIRRSLVTGAKVQARDRFQRSALHLASNADVVRLLLAAGADVHARDYYRRTPLHLASNADVARLLLAAGANVHARNDSNCTPLFFSGDDVARVLVENGADMHARNSDGSTPLHCARSAAVARTLIDAGANLHARDNNDCTVLHRSKEINRSMRECKQTSSPRLAIDVGLVRFLLEAGADMHARDLDGNTPLLSLSKHVELVRLLLEAGADVHARNSDSRTALHMADADVARLLLAAGASVNAQDASGSTALHQAADTKYVDVMQILLDAGGDTNLRDNENRTSLHRWIQNLWIPWGCKEEVRYSLSAPSAHVHQRNVHSCNVAASLDLLLEYGADVNARGKYDIPPLGQLLDYASLDARGTGMTSVLKKLVAAGAHIAGRQVEMRSHVIGALFGVQNEEQLLSKARRERWYQYLTPQLQRRLFSTTLERICIRRISDLQQQEEEQEKEDDDDDVRQCMQYDAGAKRPLERKKNQDCVTKRNRVVLIRRSLSEKYL